MCWKLGLLAMGQKCEWEVRSCPQWMHIWGVVSGTWWAASVGVVVTALCLLAKLCVGVVVTVTCCWVDVGVCVVVCGWSGFGC